MHRSNKQRELERQANELLRQAGCTADGQPKRKGAYWQRKFEGCMTRCPFGRTR